MSYSRRNDPETSHEAAEALSDEVLSHLHQTVINTLGKYRGGLTTVEIADYCKLPRDTISPRMKTLVAKNLVFDSGEKRVPLGMKRKGIVWKIVPQRAKSE